MGKGSKKKPPPEKPDWEKLEEIVAAIQKELAPNAVVRHNHKIRGRSGRTRQLDVTITQRVGSSSVFIVIECKRNSRPVGIEKVESFATKLKDVRASQGIIISNKGFDAGAKAIASQENILLQSYREAEETDWKELIGDTSWITLTYSTFEVTQAFVNTEASDSIYPIPYLTAIFDEVGKPFPDGDGQPLNIPRVFAGAWNELSRPRPIGKVDLTIERIKPSMYIKLSEQLVRVQGFYLIGIVRPKRYILNFQMLQGNAIENTDPRKLEYMDAITKGFVPKHIVESQEGITFTSEEWEIAERTTVLEHRIHPDYSYNFRVIDGNKETLPQKKLIFEGKPVKVD